MPTAKVRLGGSIQQKKGLVFGGNQDDVEDDSRQSGLVLYVCEVAEVLEVGAVGNGGPTCKRTTSATTAINDLAKRAHGRLGDSGIRLRGGESREQPSYSHRWAKLPTTAAQNDRAARQSSVSCGIIYLPPPNLQGRKKTERCSIPPPLQRLFLRSCLAFAVSEQEAPRALPLRAVATCRLRPAARAPPSYRRATS